MATRTEPPLCWQDAKAAAVRLAFPAEKQISRLQRLICLMHLAPNPRVYVPSLTYLLPYSFTQPLVYLVLISTPTPHPSLPPSVSSSCSSSSLSSSLVLISEIRYGGYVAGGGAALPPRTDHYGAHRGLLVILNVISINPSPPFSFMI